MKAIITLLVLGGLGLGAMYMFGGYSSFDPEKQGKEARASIKPGMTLQQVIKYAGSNPKFQAINKYVHTDRGETYEEFKEGTPVDFHEDRVKQSIKDKKYPHGFILTYRYTESVAFAVRFDGSAKVESVEDVLTFGDLLQSR
jgi:hypothetical protein